MKIEIDRLTLVQARDALDLAQALCEKSVHHGQLLTAYTALREALAAQQAPNSVEIDGIETEPAQQTQAGSAAKGAIMGAAYDFRDAHISGSSNLKRSAHAALEDAVDTALNLSPKQDPDALHLAAMDLARKQMDRIAELEAEVTRFRTDAMNEKSARQSLEQQLAALAEPVVEPVATFDEVFDAIDWDVWRMQPIRELVRMIHGKTAPQPATQQAPDALHLAAMDLARTQAQRIAELEQQLAARVPLTDEQMHEVRQTSCVQLLGLAKQWADNKIHVYQFTNEAEKIITAVARRVEAAHGIQKDTA